MKQFLQLLHHLLQIDATITLQVLLDRWSGATRLETVVQMAIFLMQQDQ